MDLNTGIGVSVLNNSFKAGEEAAKKALEELGAKSADVVIAFAAPKFEQQKMLDGIKSAIKKIPMIGGTTAGEISTYGLSVNSVVVMALNSKNLKFHTGIGKNIGKSEISAGKQLAKSVLKKTSKKSA